MQPDSKTARTTLVDQLQRNIERIERTPKANASSVVSSGCEAIDRLLPDNGYRRGTIIEWVTGSVSRQHQNLQSVATTSGGHGADFLSLATATNAIKDGGALAVADRLRQFYPPAARQMGIDLGNVIVIRPPDGDLQDNASQQDDAFLWAIDQALRCPAVAVVWAILDRIDERWFRRFQLSVEASGTMGLFVRHANALTQSSWSAVQWHVTGLPTRRIKSPHHNSSYRSITQSCRLELVRCLGGRTGGSVDIEIDAVTGSISQRSTTPHSIPRREAKAS